MNVSRVLALGGSICCVVQGAGGLGGLRCNNVSIAGGSAKEGPHVRGGSELGSYEDLMNVLRILVLGGSFCRILRGSEALGGTMSNEAVSPGGSAKEGPHVRGGI